MPALTWCSGAGAAATCVRVTACCLQLFSSLWRPGPHQAAGLLVTAAAAASYAAMVGLRLALQQQQARPGAAAPAALQRLREDATAWGATFLFISQPLVQLAAGFTAGAASIAAQDNVPLLLLLMFTGLQIPRAWHNADTMWLPDVTLCTAWMAVQVVTSLLLAGGGGGCAALLTPATAAGCLPTSAALLAVAGAPATAAVASAAQQHAAIAAAGCVQAIAVAYCVAISGVLALRPRLLAGEGHGL